MSNCPEVNIRLANEDDAYTIASIHVASWQKIYRGHIRDSVLDQLSVADKMVKWRDLISNGVLILLIQQEENIVGFASIGPSRDSDTNAMQCGEISAFYLHPDVWRQGLGKKLCVATLHRLEKMGFSELILWVLKENIQARKFYEAMGFSETGHTKAEAYSASDTLSEVRYWRKI